MPDREKVIKGLKCLITNETPCEGCPYMGSGYCLMNIAKDAKELLKEQDERIKTLESLRRIEQETVEPKKSDNPEESEYCCGVCGYPLWLDDLYCAHCGRRIGWEGR